MPTFSKSERLCSKVLIEKVFNEGHSFYIEPFKIIWIETIYPDFKFNAQILIGVSKKAVKKSVCRNKLKRQIKEAYRLNKHILYNTLVNSNKQCAIALIYTGKIITDYNYIQNKILLILQRLKNEINGSLI